MSISPLSAPRRETGAVVESAVSRLDRLRAEMNEIAREQTDEFERAIVSVTTLAQQIAEGGEAYSVGAREVARRLGGQLAAATLTLETLRIRGL